MRNEDLVREVEQFLYREARLLDDRRFHEWLDSVHRRCPLLDDRAQQPLPADRARRSRSSTPSAMSRTKPRRTTSWRCSTKPRRAWPPASPGSTPAWPGPRTRPRAPAICHQYRGRSGRHRRRDHGLFELSRLSQPRRNRAGFLCRRAPGRPAAGRRRLEDRATPPGARPERADRQKHQHVFLKARTTRRCSRLGRRTTPAEADRPMVSSSRRTPSRRRRGRRAEFRARCLSAVRAPCRAHRGRSRPGAGSRSPT